MFDLRLNPDDINCSSGVRCSGIIECDSVIEKFTSSLEFWDPNKYLLHWRRAAERLFNSSYSVFLTDVFNPDGKGHLFGYRFFIIREVIYIQESIFFSDKYDLRDLIDLRLPRESFELIDEDGNELETWRCPTDEVVSYYQRLLLKTKKFL